MNHKTTSLNWLSENSNDNSLSTHIFKQVIANLENF